MWGIALLLFTFPCFAIWAPPESFNSSYLEIEEHLLASRITKNASNAKTALNNETVSTILEDKMNRVSDDFTIPKYFKASVQFWFSIYTQYTSQHVVIHDKENLNLIYNVIDFSELHNSSINRFSKSKLQSDLSLEHVRRIRGILKSLRSKNLSKLNTEEYAVLKSINKVFKTPKNKKRRIQFFKNLSKNLRTQTGQRDMIHQGVVRSLPYQPYLVSQFKYFKLPKELLAIAFLESSFNIQAESKAAAVGIWQFMPYIGNLFMPRRSKYSDYRQNPIISSISAMHLLKQNKMILKRWDLAVPAYNSGTKHLVRAKRQFKNIKDLSLEYVLKHYKNSHIGFASKNFYSEFLALAHVLAYKDIIYPLKGISINNYFGKSDSIHIFVTKCSLKPKKFFNKQISSSPKIKELNSHFKYLNRSFPRGTVVVSNLNLTKRKYFKLSAKHIRSHYPKNYYKLIRNKKCN